MTYIFIDAWVGDIYFGPVVKETLNFTIEKFNCLPKF